MDQGVVRSLKAKYHSQIIQQIIKAIDANKSTRKVNILDAMKIIGVCWEDVELKEQLKSVLLNLVFHLKSKSTHKMI